MRKLLAVIALIAAVAGLSGCHWHYGIGYGFRCGPSISLGALHSDPGWSHGGGWHGRGGHCR